MITVEQLIKQLQAVPNQQSVVVAEVGYVPGDELAPIAAKGVYVEPDTNAVAIASVSNSSIYSRWGFRAVVVPDA